MSPLPKEIERFYRYWGVTNIFQVASSANFGGSHLRLKPGELVDKRNGIAHGDLATEATQANVSSHIDAIRVFCDSADAALGGTPESTTRRRTSLVICDSD